jgi:8-oxo-dGTP pyrophosphatase MutT (NUDIX family)
MASLGASNHDVVVLPVGGSKASHIKLVLQRKLSTGKTWFHVGSIGFMSLPNEAPADVAVRELFEEIGLILTADDLTLLSGNPLRVPLPHGQHQLVHVFSASFHVLHVIANLRTPTKVEQVVSA